MNSTNENRAEHEIYLISPSSAVNDPAALAVGASNLRAYGFKVVNDRTVNAQHQRFAGSDDQRASAFKRAAKSKAPIVMTSRGGYGMTRILNSLDFEALADANKHWVGLSDFTAFHLAMLSVAGAGTWAGPALIEDFACAPEQINEDTADIFCDAMHGRLYALGFQSDAPAGIQEQGVLWGGNLSLVCALQGSRYFPDVKNGLLFLEEVGEHPYRVERMLTQLLHSGVIDRQRAVIFGYVNRYKAVPNDRGYDWNSVLKWLSRQTDTPIVSGLPFGHDHPKFTLPHGATLGLRTDGQEARLAFPSH
jgi:muramoyltetrapeptide carboxypeptidase